MLGTAQAQITQKEKVYSRPYFGSVTKLVTTFEDQSSETRLVWTTRDMKYKHLVQYITVYSGTPEEFAQFCDELLAFAQEHKSDASTRIHDTHVSVDKFMGAQQLTIYEKRPGGSLHGYRMFTPKQIAKAQAKILGKL